MCEYLIFIKIITIFERYHNVVNRCPFSVNFRNARASNLTNKGIKCEFNFLINTETGHINKVTHLRYNIYFIFR